MSDFYEIWGRDGTPERFPSKLLWRASAGSMSRQEIKTSEKIEAVLEECRQLGYRDLELREVEG